MPRPRLWRCLVLNVLAFFPSGAAASWPSPPLFGATPTAASFADLLTAPGYVSQSSAAAAAQAASVADLRNVTLRVGVAVNFVFPSLGVDNLVRFTSVAANSYGAWAGASPGTAIRVDPADLTGQMVWLMNFIATSTNCSLEYYAITLPTALANASDSTFKALWILNDLGLDVALYGITNTAPRRQYMRFSSDFTFYRHQIVARRATLPVRTWRDTVWNWTKPFTYDAWLCLVSLVVVQAVVVYQYDKHSAHRSKVRIDEATRVLSVSYSTSFLKAFSLSTLIAMLSVINTNNITPVTFSARMFMAVSVFCQWLIMATYIANLTAILTSRPVPVQVVTGIDSFASLRSPICVRNNSIQIHYLSNLYPSVPVSVIGPLTTSMLDAVVSGACLGGIDDELILRWYLDQGDASGAYCGIDLIGPPLTPAYPFALAFPLDATRIPDSAISGVNLAIASALYNGNYSSAETQLLPSDRGGEPCAAYFASIAPAAATGVRPLQATDLSGILFVAAGALVLTLIGRMVKQVVKGLLPPPHHPPGLLIVSGGGEKEGGGGRGGGSVHQGWASQNLTRGGKPGFLEGEADTPGAGI